MHLTFTCHLVQDLREIAGRASLAAISCTPNLYEKCMYSWAEAMRKDIAHRLSCVFFGGNSSQGPVPFP